MANQRDEAEKLNASPTFLTFHRLSRGFTWGATNFSPQRFRGLLETLLEAGYRLHSTNEKPTRWSTGDPAIAISFDDAYEELHQELPPLMEQFRLSPTIFVPTAFVGRSNRWDYASIFSRTNHLSETQITDLRKAGVEFGTHGHTHRDLTRLDSSALSIELRHSRDQLKQILGESVDCLSYPFGRLGPKVVAAAEEAGYRRAYTMRFPEPDDPAMATGRIAVYAFDSPLSVLRKLRTGRLRGLEALKGRIVNRLSGGTTLLNRMLGR